MTRKGTIAKRDVLPDPMYNSKLVTRLINRVMLQISYTTLLVLLKNQQEMIHWKFLNKQWKTLCLY